MKRVAACIPFFLFLACNSAEDKKAPADTDSVLYTVKGDTTIINGDAAVFYEQDSTKVEAEKSKNAADFTLGLEDYHMYLDSTNRFLDSIKLAKVDAKGSRFIKFVKRNNSVSVIKVDSLPTLWGVYLFTPAKDPEEADMTDMQGSYKNYFK